VPDVPSARDEVAALRAANARLRQVIEAKDTAGSLSGGKESAILSHTESEAGSRSVTGAGPRPARKYPPIWTATLFWA
jgi:hypothetical protein